MRLLLVSHAFLPDSRGGVEICTAYLGLALRQRGHEVHILHRVARPDRPEYEVQHGIWEGMAVATVNNTFSEVRGFEMAYRNRTIEKLFASHLRELEPDLIHFHHLTCLSSGLPLVARELGIPTLLTLHDYWLACQRGQMLRPDLEICAEPVGAVCAQCLAPQIPTGAIGGPAGAQPSGSVWDRGTRFARRVMTWVAQHPPWAPARRLGDLGLRLLPEGPSAHEQRLSQIEKRRRHVTEVLAAVDQLITPSDHHRNQFIRYGVPPERIIMRHNGVRTEAFENHEHSPSDHLRFGFLGSIIPSKGVHVLLEAFNGLEDVAATLDVHGWAPPYEGYPTYYQDLKKGANPRVQFHGAYDNAQVSALLAEIDVLVIPSIWAENAPVTIQEARLARVPVIGSRIGGIPEFVEDGVSGLLFTPRDAGDLRARMLRLVDDPGLLDRLREGIQPVKTFEEHAVEMETLYGPLVAGGRT